jgi:hypothetical protein
MTIPAGFAGVESVQASLSGLHSGDDFHENGLMFLLISVILCDGRKKINHIRIIIT